MTHVRIAELKDHLSEHLRAVERGGEVVVMDRDRPIARIVPIPPAGPPLRLIHPVLEFATVRGRKHPPAGWSVDSTTLLLEEREGR